MVLRWTGVAALVVFGVGCASVTETIAEPASARDDLAEAETDWQQLDAESYLVVVTQSDPGLRGCRWVTEVHGTSIDSRWSSEFDNECEDRDVSIPALHREISGWMAEVEASSGNLDIEWAGDGVPSSIEFDLAGSEGEEWSLVVEFQDLTGASAEVSVRAALADARDRWAEAGIDSYRIQVAESRNYWSSGCTWITVVVDGAVTETSIDPASTRSDCLEASWTVGQLHAQIARWADNLDEYSDSEFGVDTLEVEFNDLGVPETMKFDLANGSDEESSLRLTFTTSP